MLKADKFTEFKDGELIDADKAFYTGCDVCGEWLQYMAKVDYDPNGDIQSILIEAESCGEVFRLVPTQFKMVKISKSELL